MNPTKKAVKIETNLPAFVSVIGRPKFSECTLGIVLVAVFIVTRQRAKRLDRPAQ